MNSFHQNLSCNANQPDRHSPSKQHQESFLMQRILACGQLHRRCQCYSITLDLPACQANPPYTVVDAAVCGNPSWQEIPCHERGAILLQLLIPLSFQLKDCNGCHFTASGSIEEQIRLHLACPESECWRGQIFVQSAARLCGNASVCQDGSFEARLEILLDAYLLSPCPFGIPTPRPCPPSKPWYPEAHFDPWQNR